MIKQGILQEANLAIEKYRDTKYKSSQIRSIIRVLGIRLEPNEKQKMNHAKAKFCKIASHIQR